VICFSCDFAGLLVACCMFHRSWNDGFNVLLWDVTTVITHLSTCVRVRAILSQFWWNFAR